MFYLVEVFMPVTQVLKHLKAYLQGIHLELVHVTESKHVSLKSEKLILHS